MEASMEALVETGILPGPVFHPGGLDMTRELADMCGITSSSGVLDVACGTGESACFLAESYGCDVVGIDTTPLQVERAKKKTAERNLSVEFLQADSHDLPFENSSFDVVISEAVLCYLEIDIALKEMVRVAKAGGRVGTQDMFWQDDTPDAVKQRYAEIENEHPETLFGWVARFENAGLIDIVTVDRSEIVRRWSTDYKRQLGLIGLLRIFLAIVRRWGIAGFRRIQESERIWESTHAGYALIVGSKRDKASSINA